eukprot:8844939-Pyramimonas_sp.AAC.1
MAMGRPMRCRSVVTNRREAASSPRDDCLTTNCMQRDVANYVLNAHCRVANRGLAHNSTQQKPGKRGGPRATCNGRAIRLDHPTDRALPSNTPRASIKATVRSQERYRK